MEPKRLTRTVDGKVEEVLLMVWNGVRIMRGTPHPDGPQGSFERIQLEGAAAAAEAERRLAAFRAEGFREIVDDEEPAPEPKRAAKVAPEKPSQARPVKAKPRWMRGMPASVEKELAKIRKALGKAGLAHRAAEIEVLARPGMDLKLKRAKPADLKGVASRMGGDPDLPPKTPWPAVKKTKLGFIAQIVIADVKEHDLEGILPRAGVLSFFGQMDVDWPGYTDVGAILVFPRADKLVRTASPSGVPRIEKVGLFLHKPRVSLPPSYDPAIEKLRLNREESRAYGNLFSEWIPEGRNHTLLGWPTASTLHCMKGKRFVGQLDSDQHLDFEMGDYETLRFYVDGDVLDERTVASTVCTVSEA